MFVKAARPCVRVIVDVDGLHTTQRNITANSRARWSLNLQHCT
jgi:hypothetical protein